MDDSASPRLLDRVREKIRVKHYSIRTEQAYVDWIKRFIRFHGKQHPSELGAAAVEAFLADLAVARQVSSSTQNQAKSALLFLYKEVLGTELPWLSNIQTAKAPERLPVVLTREEVASVLARLQGVHALIGRLLYGTGMRVMEAMRLRVKDVDFARREILVRDGKGFKDRVTMLPQSISPALRRQLECARSLHIGTCVRDSARYGFPPRCRASIRMRRASGLGNTCFLPSSARAIRAAARRAAIICPTRRFSGRCVRLYAMRD